MTDRLTRRSFLARGAGLAAGAATTSFLGFGPSVNLVSAHNVSGNRERAIDVYNAMQKYFYLADKKLYRQVYPYKSGNPYSYLWPFVETMAATIDVYGVGGADVNAVNDRRSGLQAYWDDRTSPPPAYDSYVRAPLGPGGDKYYDDNSWVGRNLVQLYRMSNNTDGPALDRAKKLFDFTVSGWDTDTGHQPNGGVFWVEASWNRDRGTGPTAGAAKEGFHLAELTGSSTYRDWAVRMYNWTRQYLFDSQASLYWDKFTDLNGTIYKVYWAYNQGLMIADSVFMYQSTGDSQYRTHAEAVADAMLAIYSSRGYYSQPAIFNVLFFRYLLRLYTVSKKSAYLDAMRSYADKVWNDRAYHNKRTHLYKDPYDSDGSTSTYELLDQAAMVQLYALLAWVDAGRDLRQIA